MAFRTVFSLGVIPQLFLRYSNASQLMSKHTRSASGVVSAGPGPIVAPVYGRGVGRLGNCVGGRAGVGAGDGGGGGGGKASVEKVIDSSRNWPQLYAANIFTR